MNQWNKALSITDPKEFIREMARFVIGEDILLISTVSGKASNRSRKDGSNQTFQSVDSVKIDAITGK